MASIVIANSQHSRQHRNGHHTMALATIATAAIREDILGLASIIIAMRQDTMRQDTMGMASIATTTMLIATIDPATKAITTIREDNLDMTSIVIASIT